MKTNNIRWSSTKDNMGPKKRTNVAPIFSPTSSHPSPQMKFRPTLETSKSSAKGTKPLPDPITIPELFVKLLVHVCKKVLFVNPLYRILGYGILLFLVSLVADYAPFPRTYFSSNVNFLNQYFVKFSWGWTLSLLGLFMSLTTSVYCCGKGPQMSRHLCRLIIATIIWFIWTSTFQIIEETTGQCIYTANTNTQTPSTILYSKGRRHCNKSGGKWMSLDISGHSFILIWCTLFIIEECKAIVGWDTIADFIRNEEYRRTGGGRRPSDLTTTTYQGPANDEDLTPISHLTIEEFDSLKKSYLKFGFWAKIVLVALTLLSLLWDIMLIATATYFHDMIEKVLAGLIAVSMWVCTYRGYYTWDIFLSPGLPGVGIFKYSSVSSNMTEQKPSSSKIGNNNLFRQGPVPPDEVPHFMGMPIYPPKKSKEMITGIIGVEGISVPK